MYDNSGGDSNNDDNEDDQTTTKTVAKRNDQKWQAQCVRKQGKRDFFFIATSDENE